MMIEVYGIWGGTMAGDLMTQNLLMLTPVFNMAFFLLALGVTVFYVVAGLYAKWKTPESEWQNIVVMFVILANILTLFALTKEIALPFEQEKLEISRDADARAESNNAYQAENTPLYHKFGYAGARDDTFYKSMEAKENEQNTAISVLWALYATLLLGVGFARRVRALRILGLFLFFVTMFKVLIDVWSLGQLYRIVSTLVVGVIALSAAFLYAKFKDRIKELI